jgi:hypothetical protein
MTISVIPGNTLGRFETIEALTVIADNLRQSDRDEVALTSGLAPIDALIASWMLSTHAFLVFGRDGVPVAAFGAAPAHLPGVGAAWMLGTDGILTESRPIARETRKYLDEIAGAYPLLWNYVDARNTTSRRWLRWGGFEVVGTTTMGPEAHPFHIFAKTTHGKGCKTSATQFQSP